MNNLTSSSVLFLTTTIGTRWVFYQQFLLKKFFPNAKRVLIDGNVRWDFNKGLKCVWYDFIFIALKNKKKYKYFIHLDEDCFITNPNGIEEVIEYMDREGIDLMGPSEVIKRIRGENPYALNSFFMIGKIETLEKVMREYQINLKFSSLNLECDIDEYKKEYEPYYDFFWNYYKKGYKISFLSTDFDEEYRCTSLLDNKGTPFGFHMWYTRDWYSKKMTPLGLSNFDRYSKMRRFLKMNFDISKLDLIRLNIWTDYMIISFSRIFIKNIYRVRRRLVNK